MKMSIRREIVNKQAPKPVYQLDDAFDFAHLDPTTADLGFDLYAEGDTLLPASSEPEDIERRLRWCLTHGVIMTPNEARNAVYLMHGVWSRISRREITQLVAPVLVDVQESDSKGKAKLKEVNLTKKIDATNPYPTTVGITRDVSEHVIIDNRRNTFAGYWEGIIPEDEIDADIGELARTTIPQWLRLNLAAGNDAAADFLTDVLAYHAQHPNSKVQYIILMVGGQGIGKSLLLTGLYGRLMAPTIAVWGSDGVQKGHTNSIVEANVVIIDDASFRLHGIDHMGNSAAGDLMRTLVTEEEAAYSGKYMIEARQRTFRLCFNTTNAIQNPESIRGSRRLALVQGLPGTHSNRLRFGPLYEAIGAATSTDVELRRRAHQLRSEWYRMLMERDVEHFDPTQAPTDQTTIPAQYVESSIIQSLPGYLASIAAEGVVGEFIQELTVNNIIKPINEGQRGIEVRDQRFTRRPIIRGDHRGPHMIDADTPFFIDKIEAKDVWRDMMIPAPLMRLDFACYAFITHERHNQSFGPRASETVEFFQTLSDLGFEKHRLRPPKQSERSVIVLPGDTLAGFRAEVCRMFDVLEDDLPTVAEGEMIPPLASHE